MSINNHFKVIKKQFLNAMVNALDFEPEGKKLMFLRVELLRLAGWKIERPFHVCPGLYFLKGSNIQIGSNGGVGAFCKIHDWHPITIGKNFLSSNNLSMVSASHDLNDRKAVAGPIVIGDNVWVGTNVTIVGPVTIGSGCVIGAGSVVLRDLPPDSICAGIPAKKIRSIK